MGKHRIYIFLVRRNTLGEGRRIGIIFSLKKRKPVNFSRIIKNIKCPDCLAI